MNERRRIARERNDSVGSVLAGVSMNLSRRRLTLTLNKQPDLTMPEH